jgi:hypothetical protein
MSRNFHWKFFAGALFFRELVRNVRRLFADFGCFSVQHAHVFSAAFAFEIAGGYFERRDVSPTPNRFEVFRGFCN